MKEIIFYKVEASGNDFVLIDNRKKFYKFDYSTFAKIVCDRHRAVGADGILILEKSVIADFKMRYLNADGSEGGMCGNGGRAIAKFASLVFKKNKLSFEALNYIYNAEINNDIILLSMKNPDNLKNIVIDFNNSYLPAWYINTGAPHTVIFFEDILLTYKDFDNFNMFEFGRYIRYNKIFHPEGTNVNVVELVNSNTIKIRTYERGVENETLSCGTGSIASAIVSSLKFKLKPPIKVIPLSKDKIIINFKHNNNEISKVTIKGKATIVFKGELIYNPKNNRVSYNIL